MKKTLLLGMGLVCGFAAMAQQEGTDATPKNYNFNEASVIPWFNNKVAANKGEGAGFQTGGGNYEASGGVWQNLPEAPDYWNDGLIGVVSSGGLNEAQANNLIEGCSLVNLGGEVGQVFCWQGKDTNLKAQLESIYPGKDWSFIPEPAPGPVGGWNFNFFLNPNDTWTHESGYYRMRMILNVLHVGTEANEEQGIEKVDAFDGSNVINNIYQVNNQGNNMSFIGADYQQMNDAEGAVKVPAISNRISMKMVPGFDVPDEGELGEYLWDPTRWAIVDYYFNVAGNAMGVDENGDPTVPVRIKMIVNGSQAWNKLAVLIKEIKVEKFEGVLPLETYNLNLEAPTTVYYKLVEEVEGPGDEPGDDNGVESIGSDNAPVEFFNLQGVKVVNPENGVFIRKQGNTITKVIR